MPYLGKNPQHGNYSKLDDFSGDFDGSDATHALASGGTAITPVRPEALLISINGVIQEPVTDYTVSGTNITFTTAPAATDSFFGVALGEQLAIGTPSDGTVTSGKLSGDLTLPGDLTIGDASAADAKLVFDGNAQDYHFGLQDSSDDLVIGLGSTLGTTTHMAFDETGAIRKPLQPCVLAQPSGTQSNLTTGSAQDIAFATEIFDQNADFSTPSFTAPCDGKYLVTVACRLENVDTAADYYVLYVTASNRTLFFDMKRPSYTYSSDVDYGIYFMGTCIIDMDASDTVKIQIRQDGGTAQTDVLSGTSTNLGVCLIA